MNREIRPGAPVPPPAPPVPLPEPAEITLASAEAIYIHAGRLEDGTVVVRDAGGVLHALVPVKRACDS